MHKKIWAIFIVMMYFTNSFAIEITTRDTQKMDEKIQELVIEDIKVGEGREAEKGLTISVHYTGWIYDSIKNDKKGDKFDSSLDRREPFSFVLGVGQVIKGWDEGFDGMKIGGKRTILIPADMGYGSRGAGNAIPPNADLIFEVELLEIL
jgi:FKBP-type peptidyl-prolyl cis-trans isomerase FkpA